MIPDNLYPFFPFLVAYVPFAFVSTSYCPLSQYKPACTTLQIKKTATTTIW